MEELEEDESGVWVTLSMNLDRTNITFMLTLALAAKVAELSDSNILDEAGILDNDRFIAPSYVYKNFKKNNFKRHI